MSNIDPEEWIRGLSGLIASQAKLSFVQGQRDCRFVL